MLIVNDFGCTKLMMITHTSIQVWLLEIEFERLRCQSTSFDNTKFSIFLKS